MFLCFVCCLSWAPGTALAHAVLGTQPCIELVWAEAVGAVPASGPLLTSLPAALWPLAPCSPRRRLSPPPSTL